MVARVLVFSDFWYQGEAAGIEFVLFENANQTEAVAARIMVLLGAKETVFLQDGAGDGISGGPVPANTVVELIPFGQIAAVTGETAEEVKRRLIVFTLSPEEGGKLVIPLQCIEPRDLKLTVTELEGKGHNHPLNQILELAKKAIN